MAVEIRVRSTVAKSVPNLNQLQSTAQRLLNALGLTKAELSILLTGDSEIRALNRAWRQVDAPTDVLSFSQIEGPPEPTYSGPLGDIVVSLDTAIEQAKDGYHKERLGLAEWTVEDEVLFLLVHGLLHLAGHDHDDDDSEAMMRAEERRLFELVRAEAAETP